MKCRHYEAVGARFEVCGESAVVAEEEDAAALRGQAARALHGDERLPRACAT